MNNQYVPQSHALKIIDMPGLIIYERGEDWGPDIRIVCFGTTRKEQDVVMDITSEKCSPEVINKIYAKLEKAHNQKALKIDFLTETIRQYLKPSEKED
ncbi:hypothetical protein AYK26_03090 [Euryarchaeota archaeon SM23-78]|nr:MAG: hypothetical protein AYK26_03090 [Euryarchaeota archaeon SM23-78]MBW3000430.1 hypothetical protein [Candidatus Woesearchaeota archaeon]